MKLKYMLFSSIFLMCCIGYSVVAQDQYYPNSYIDIEWSPNGQWLATVGTQGQLRLTNLTTNNTVQTTVSNTTINALSWSPDSSKLALAGHDGKTRIFDLASQSVVTNLIIRNGAFVVKDVKWSSDGSKIAVIDSGEISSIGIWNTTNYQMIASTNIPPSSALALLNNNTKIAYDDYLSGVFVYPATLDMPITNYAQRLTYRVGYTGAVQTFAFRNDTQVAIAEQTGNISIWNLSTNTQIATYSGTPQIINSLAWSPNQNLLAVAQMDGHVKIWDFNSKSLVGDLHNSSISAVYSVAWSPDGSQLGFVGQFSNPQQPTPPIIVPTTSFLPPAYTCTHTVTASSASSLISAIVSANSASTPSTICLGGGTYTLTAVNNSDESPNGLPSITKNITIIGNNSVIERATSAPQFRIFRVASNGRLSLNNLTVRGGHAGSLSGGGVRNLGILELNTVIVENNTGNAGGGIRNNNNATFSAINSLIRNNVSTTNGGGLYANNGSSTTLTNTNFLGNTTNASNGLGGAIFSNGNVFNMSGGIIQNNSARNGGGIFVNITTQAMSLSNVQFTGNIASNHGAGIYHLSGTTFSVQNGRFTSNIATNEGGAIAGDGTFTITNSNFLSNSANIGGAIHAQATSGSSIQQSCIENNTAPNTIGIFNEASVILNAQNNFWGSAGASASVSANVNTNGALTTCGNG